MSLMEEIKDMGKRIEALDDRSAELGHQAWDLRRQREELIAKLIIEEDLFSGTTWDVELGNFVSSSGAHLNYTGLLVDNSPMKKIADMARKEYHSTFELTVGVNVRFDDNGISLTFKEGKMMLPFVEKHGLVINGTSIQDKLAKLKRDVAALELVCHQLKL
jgi:hypothetical protein